MEHWAVYEQCYENPRRRDRSYRGTMDLLTMAARTRPSASEPNLALVHRSTIDGDPTSASQDIHEGRCTSPSPSDTSSIEIEMEHSPGLPGLPEEIPMLAPGANMAARRRRQSSRNQRRDNFQYPHAQLNGRAIPWTVGVVGTLTIGGGIYYLFRWLTD